MTATGTQNLIAGAGVNAISRQGRGAIRLGSDHERGGLVMRQKMLSPAFTTSWKWLPLATG